MYLSFNSDDAQGSESFKHIIMLSLFWEEGWTEEEDGPAADVVFFLAFCCFGLFCSVVLSVCFALENCLIKIKKRFTMDD